MLNVFFYKFFGAKSFLRWYVVKSISLTHSLAYSHTYSLAHSLTPLTKTHSVTHSISPRTQSLHPALTHSTYITCLCLLSCFFKRLFTATVSFSRAFKFSFSSSLASYVAFTLNICKQIWTTWPHMKSFHNKC